MIVTQKSYDKALVQWTHGGEETTGFYIRAATVEGEVNVTTLLDPPGDLTSRQEYVIDVVVGNVYNVSVINQYRGWDSPDYNPITYVARKSFYLSGFCCGLGSSGKDKQLSLIETRGVQGTALTAMV